MALPIEALDELADKLVEMLREKRGLAPSIDLSNWWGESDMFGMGSYRAVADHAIQQGKMMRLYVEGFDPKKDVDHGFKTWYALTRKYR
ncbi:MAG: hypothetical protein Q8R53_03070 [Nanoarchaeota archaeon]|nr:hypothetical protein [Nanoarchaeota archaeon]